MNTRSLWITGIVLLGLCLLGFKSSPTQFFAAYLIAFLLWLGISLGATGIWMLYHLVGGDWGVASLPVLRAASRTLPLMCILFIPLLFALHVLYPWAAGTAPAELVEPMSWYLNAPFFYLRAAACFVVWLGVAWLLWRRQGRAEALSAFGLVLYAVTISVAAFDWILSLDLHNRSSIFGFLVIIGQVLGAFSFTILALMVLRREGDARVIAPNVLQDLGNLLFTSVILWAYMAYSQFIITWSGQMREEVVWYNHRFLGGWGPVGGFLLLFNFILPFALLLFRAVKRSPKHMARLAGWLVFMQWINTVWLVLPSVSPMRMTWSWMQFVAPAAVGVLWLAAFLAAWRQGSILAFGARKERHGNA